MKPGRYIRFLLSFAPPLISVKTKNHKIQILSAWKKQYGATVNVNEIEVEGFNQPVLQLVDEWPEPIRPYTSKLTWNYNANNPSLEEIAPDELLVKLEDLTQCKFFKDLNLSKIYIGAFSEDESHRAVCKLDTIQKAWVSTSTLTTVIMIN